MQFRYSIRLLHYRQFCMQHVHVHASCTHRITHVSCRACASFACVSESHIGNAKLIIEIHVVKIFQKTYFGGPVLRTHVLTFWVLSTPVLRGPQDTCPEGAWVLSTPVLRGAWGLRTGVLRAQALRTGVLRPRTPQDRCPEGPGPLRTGVLRAQDRCPEGPGPLRTGVLRPGPSEQVS